MAESFSMPGDRDASPVSFHQLAAEHSSLDSQLQKLHEKRYLTTDDELEATRLKKLKLHVKDVMRQMER